MLKSMRRNHFMRNLIIFGIVALLASYVLVAWGQAPPTVQGDTIARMGSSKIKMRDALIAKKNIRSWLNQMDISDDDQINNFATGQLVNDALMMHGANQLGLHVSDAELRDYVVDFRKRAAGEGEDAYLTSQQWNDFITYNFNLQVEDYEQYLREHQLKVQRFKDIFADAAFIPDSEIEKTFTEQNQKLSLAMLSCNLFSARNQVNLSDDEIKAIYDKDPEAFMSGDQRKIQYVKFALNDYTESIEPTEEEIADYYDANKGQPQFTSPATARVRYIQFGAQDYEQAKKVRVQLDQGMDFKEAIETYSTDKASIARKGDSGFMQRQAMAARFSPEFADAAFALEQGAYSDPVKTRSGYALIKKLEQRPQVTRTLDQARSQIVSTLKRSQGKDKARTDAADFLAKVREGADFSAAASELELTLNESEFFDANPQSNLGEGLDQNARVRNSVFQLAAVGDTSEIIELGTGFVVANWSETHEPQVLAFEANKQRIRRDAESKRTKQVVENAFNQIKKAMAADETLSLQSFIESYPFLNENSYKETEPFGTNNVPIELQDPAIDFHQDLFSHAIGEIIGPVATQNDRTYVLAKVRDKLDVDQDALKEQRLAIVQQLRTDHVNDLLTTYSTSAQNELDPDNRKQAQIQQSIEKIR